MKNITLELTPETAKLVLPSLERQHKVLVDQAAAIANQIEVIRTGIHQKPSAPDLFVQKVPKTKKGRSKKGETKKAVSEYLKSLNGQGAQISVIADATNTNYGSVRRILIELKSKGNASEVNGLWSAN